jgi:chaperone modulatory protein CbpM
MQEENLIPASEFCLHHNIEVSFLHSLQEYGLIDVITIQNASFVEENSLTELEKMIRLHYELDINMEGIDVIRHLLKKMEGMQYEIASLKNKLRLYESQE